jgi:hypothetical protein
MFEERGQKEMNDDWNKWIVKVETTDEDGKANIEEHIVYATSYDVAVRNTFFSGWFSIIHSRIVSMEKDIPPRIDYSLIPVAFEEMSTNEKIDVLQRKINKWMVETNAILEDMKNPVCHAGSDGDCTWEDCPQIRDGEPKKTGRSCPLWDKHHGLGS